MIYFFFVYGNVILGYVKSGAVGFMDLLGKSVFLWDTHMKCSIHVSTKIFLKRKSNELV